MPDDRPPPSPPPDGASGGAPERLRSLCLALPGVVERVSHGEPSWFAGRPGRPRQFVTLADHHHDDRLACWAAAPEGAQEHWLAVAGDRFFRPPYVGGRGWIGVYLDIDLDQDGWADIAEIVAAAHAVVTAPPRRG